jgi:capsular polysaccharide transport system permease protein
MSITISVWKALFLREAVSRLSAGRHAWLWLLLEPMVQVVILLCIFSAIRMHAVGGISTTTWLMVGLLGYNMFSRTAMQTMNSVNSNKGLFTYRQVKPVDTALVRAALEGFLTLLITMIMLGGSVLFGMNVYPNDPLAILEAFFGLWLLGTGFGLVTSVASEMIPEVGKVIGFVMTPLYFASGVIIPIALIPHPYRDWLVLNPVVHGLEAARSGFAPYYHAVPELSIAYLYVTALVTILLGLALHVRFATKLIAQ